MPNPILTHLPLNGSLSGRDRITGGFTATGVGALRWKPAEGARVNYFPEPTLSATENYWYRWSNTETINASGKGHYGANSIRLTNTVAQAIGFGAFGGLEYDGINHGKAVRISFSFRTNDPDSVFELHEYRDYTPIAVQGSYGAEWSRVELVTTVGANYTQLGFDFYSNTPRPIGTWIEFSNLVFEVAPDLSLDNYFETSRFFHPVYGSLLSANSAPSATQLAAWVEQDTTNLVRNPSATTNLTNINPAAGTTLTRELTRRTYGLYSVKVVTDGSEAYQSVEFVTNPIGGVTTARTFTASAYVHAPAGLTLRLVCRIWINAYTSAVDQITTIVTDGTWQRLVATATTVNGDTVEHVSCIVTPTDWAGSSVAATYFVDAAQIEELPYATSYCDGSLGTGYTWSGTANDSASSRAAAQIYTTHVNRAFADVGAASIRANVPHQAQGVRLLNFGGWIDSTDDDLLLWASGVVRLTVSTALDGVQRGDTYTDDFAMNAWQHCYFDWDALQIRVAVENKALVVGSRSATAGKSTFGGSVIVVDQVSGEKTVDNLIVFSRRLTDAERLAYRNAIDNNEDVWMVFQQLPHALSISDPTEPMSLARTSGSL